MQQANDINSTFVYEKLASKFLDYINFGFKANKDVKRMISMELEIPLSQTGMFVISGGFYQLI